MTRRREGGGERLSWPEFWARAADDCVTHDLPVPDEDTLRAEYIERARQRAAAEAWIETMGDTA